MEEAARIALRAMRQHEFAFDRIIACVFDEEALGLYQRILGETPVVPAPVRATGTVASLLEPSSFEIAMMAKLKAMLPEDDYERVERSRDSLAWFTFEDPEIQRIWESIEKDRTQTLEQAIKDGTYERRRRDRS
jgi:hypothetical protein